MIIVKKNLITNLKQEVENNNDRYIDYPWGFDLFCHQHQCIHYNCIIGDNEIFHSRL
jgi:hypothetical protein